MKRIGQYLLLLLALLHLNACCNLSVTVSQEKSMKELLEYPLEDVMEIRVKQ